MNRTSLLLAALIPLLPCPGGAASAPPASPQRAAKELQAVLSRLDRDLAAAARSLAKEGLTGAGARKVLTGLCLANPEVVDCAAVDPAGRMVTVAPAQYASYEGADISKQEQVARLHATRKPVLSQIFRSVEGYDALDLERPVLGRDGRLLGSASMLIKPEVLLGGLLGPLSASGELAVKVLQDDGRVLYASSKPIGKEARKAAVGLHGTRWRLVVGPPSP
ncbi:MAG: PDC sensor domain-containing protein [Elusimicrobia bacterium]|nr:PDC sensor domain-containing protein [Elusimicrobiota bacterium]